MNPSTPNMMIHKLRKLALLGVPSEELAELAAELLNAERERVSFDRSFDDAAGGADDSSNLLVMPGLRLQSV